MAESYINPGIESGTLEVLDYFERDSGWRLSFGARVVIREGIFALGTDQIGLRDLPTRASRYSAQETALKTLPLFLQKLTAKAASTTVKTSDEKLIGAIFIMQNIHDWGREAATGCWPPDE